MDSALISMQKPMCNHSKRISPFSYHSTSPAHVIKTENKSKMKGGQNLMDVLPHPSLKGKGGKRKLFSSN